MKGRTYLFVGNEVFAHGKILRLLEGLVQRPDRRVPLPPPDVIFGPLPEQFVVHVSGFPLPLRSHFAFVALLIVGVGYHLQKSGLCALFLGARCHFKFKIGRRFKG